MENYDDKQEKQENQEEEDQNVKSIIKGFLNISCFIKNPLIFRRKTRK